MGIPLSLSSAIVLLLSSFALQARGEGRSGEGAVRLLTTVPVPGKLVIFDISFVNPSTQLYYLADRSNNAIDVVDARRNVFVKQINKGGFKGFTGNNDTSGPNGVVVSGNWLFASDANSRVVAIDLRTDQVVSSVSTGGDPGLRTDEMAYDPQHGLLIAVNNADSPPFATLIKVDEQSGDLTVRDRVTFTDATNGAEQPAWDPGTGRFYVSIPELGGVCPRERSPGSIPTGRLLLGSGVRDGES